MKFARFTMDLRIRRRTKKCADLVKIIKNYKSTLPEEEFFGKSLYIGPEIPGEILEPVVNDMGFCLVEQRDYFENSFRYLLNQPSHLMILKNIF